MVSVPGITRNYKDKQRADVKVKDLAQLVADSLET